MTIVAGTHLGPYEILGPLGSGGMGEVYLARDTQLKRKIAIKVLPEKFASDPELLARFAMEARLASSLNHPNIITIYAIGESCKVPYISMELVDGKSLDELTTFRPLPLNVLLKVAKQISEGLAKAHAAGIVHRDLKPQNIMVTTDGFVKILDFGLSKLTGTENPINELSTWHAGDVLQTQSGSIIGTVAYMSPEQASGKAVDYRSDQFSFGSVLYQMATGSRPFERETTVQTLTSIIEDEPPLLAKFPVPLQLIVRRCMAKDPHERYASTTEIAADLERLTESAAVTTVGDSNLESLRGRPRSNRFTILIVLLMIALAGIVGPQIRQPMSWMRPPEGLPSEKQLAILPFANIGNDPSNQVFIDGLVETLTSKLTQLEQFHGTLRVVPASEIRRENTVNARDAQRSFGATLVITGSVQRTTDKIRFTINLVDPKTSMQLKAHSVDTEVRDIVVTQDGIVEQVARMLELDLPPSARQQLMAGGTTVPDAYDFYLQGRGYLQRYEKPENIENAIGLFKRALDKDSKYALALAGLGEAYWRKYEITKDRQWIEAAKNSCQQALQINDRLAPVHITLGLTATGSGRYEDAVKQLEGALQIDPVNADAYREIARAFEGMGKTSDAEGVYKKAIDLRPGYWAGYNELGRFYTRLARYEDAEKQFRRVIELTPDNHRAYSNVGTTYYSLKRYDEAAAMFDQSIAIMPTYTAYSNLGAVYFALGRYSDSARNFERALKINDRDYRVWRNLGSAYQWAPSEGAKAREAFEHAAKLGELELQVNARRPNLLINLADCYSMTGQAGRARDMLRRALSLAPDDAYVLFTAGSVYERLGDRKKALEWIERALQQGYSRDLVEKSPSLVELRADTRFHALWNR